MIQEFKIKNFLSFRDETTLSFEATNDHTFEDYQVVEVAPKVRLLRFLLVYGANASGKSNLLYALEQLHRFWFNRKEDIEQPTDTIPFLFDAETPHLPSEFEIKFYINSTKYWYKVSLDNTKVLTEELYYYKTVQPTLLFARAWKQGQSVIRFNPVAIKVSQAVLEELTLKCLPNMSFFAARNQVNCVLPLIDDARDWMRKGFLSLISPKTKMFEYAGKEMLEDNQLRQYILNFVQRADFNITGISTKKESIPIPNFIRNAIIENDQIPKLEKEKLLENNVLNKLDTDFEHTIKNRHGLEKYNLNYTLQSDGTCRVVGIEAAIYKALQNGGLLPIDEIESSLHPDLIEFIIEQFLKTKSHSQLLITTHYDPLLNTINDLIRKDSVWFTEKEEDGHSELYSLIDFKGLNRIRSFQKSYRNGAFGALPNIQE